MATWVSLQVVHATKVHQRPANGHQGQPQSVCAGTWAPCSFHETEMFQKIVSFVSTLFGIRQTLETRKKHRRNHNRKGFFTSGWSWSASFLRQTKPTNTKVSLFEIIPLSYMCGRPTGTVCSTWAHTSMFSFPIRFQICFHSLFWIGMSYRQPFKLKPQTFWVEMFSNLFAT